MYSEGRGCDLSVTSFILHYNYQRRTSVVTKCQDNRTLGAGVDKGGRVTSLRPPLVSVVVTDSDLEFK